MNQSGILLGMELLPAAAAVVLLAVQGCTTGDPVPTNRPDPALRQGMPYKTARAMLMNEGWQGVRQPLQTAKQRCAYRDECVTYPETESCSGTGLANCRFLFTDGQGRRLSIVTIGEERIKLDSWQFS